MRVRDAGMRAGGGPNVPVGVATVLRTSIFEAWFSEFEKSKDFLKPAPLLALRLFLDFPPTSIFELGKGVHTSFVEAVFGPTTSFFEAVCANF